MKGVTARRKVFTYRGKLCKRTRKYIRNMSGIQNHDPGVLRSEKENTKACATIVFSNYGSNNLGLISNLMDKILVDMDMSYTRVLHIKVAYRVPHK
jgi:hypothetical protein